MPEKCLSSGVERQAVMKNSNHYVWNLCCFVRCGLYDFFGSKARRTGQDRGETKQAFYREGEQSHVLIAYFTSADNMPQESLDAVSSASVQEVDGELVGNTELVAMRIQEKIHGDLFSIRTNRLYSHIYTLSAIPAWGEQTFNVKPRLVSHVEDFEEYNVIFLGYPAW